LSFQRRRFSTQTKEISPPKRKGPSREEEGRGESADAEGPTMCGPSTQVGRGGQTQPGRSPAPSIHPMPAKQKQAPAQPEAQLQRRSFVSQVIAALEGANARSGGDPGDDSGDKGRREAASIDRRTAAEAAFGKLQFDFPVSGPTCHAAMQAYACCLWTCLPCSHRSMDEPHA